MTDSKVRYNQAQKLLYALLITARKLKHYFEAHKIVVVSDYPIGDILHNRDAMGRIVKWSIELAAHDITFVPRNTIKLQVLADFVAEYTEIQTPSTAAEPEYWTMYFDGSLRIKGGGAGIIFISPIGGKLRYVLQVMFKVSNNAAEYEAALHGLRIAVSLGIKYLMVKGDSALVVNQVNKKWNRTSKKMDAYCAEIRKLEGKFYGLEFQHVLRDDNKAADELANMGSTRAQVPPGVFVQDLIKPSIKNPDAQVDPSEGLGEVLMIEPQPEWISEMVEYIKDGTLPNPLPGQERETRALHERISRRSKNYVLIGDNLYR